MTKEATREATAGPKLNMNFLAVWLRAPSILLSKYS